MLLNLRACTGPCSAAASGVLSDETSAYVQQSSKSGQMDPSSSLLFPSEGKATASGIQLLKVAVTRNAMRLPGESATSFRWKIPRCPSDGHFVSLRINRQTNRQSSVQCQSIHNRPTDLQTSTLISRPYFPFLLITMKPSCITVSEV